MSLFTSFNSGVSGLQAAQSGLNTTAHNLANTATKGYTRQQNIQTDRYYQTYKVTTDGKMKIGMGVGIADIRQIRDTFLDKEYRLEYGRQSFYEKLAETEGEVEDIFGETEGVEFQNSLNNIWDVIQTISTDREDITNRKLLVSAAESFLESAQNVYSSLQIYQTSLNTQIEEQVSKINEIGEKIAYYNTKIARAEASGLENANDYRDMRNQLMDELASYTNYDSREDSDGTVEIYINNAVFVNADISYHMGTEKITKEGISQATGKKETLAVSEMDKVVWLDNGFGDVYDLTEAYSTEKKTDVGSLLGILTARGQDVARYTDIPVKPKQKDYQTDTEYKVAMNKYKDDLKEYNNTTANSIITKIQAQFDQLIHGVVTMINDVLCPNTETQKLSGVRGTDAKGNTVTLDGSYKLLDVNNCAYGADDAETIGTELFSRSQRDRYQVLTLTQQVYGTDADGNQIALARDKGDGTFELYVLNEEDPEDINTLYTLQSLEINPKLTADYSLLPVMGNPSKGYDGAYAYDIDVYGQIAEKWSKEFAVLDPNALASYNFSDYYTNMIGDLGTQGYVWNSMVTSQTQLAENVEDKRQQVMGVSTEEELVNLLTYQHAYNAASRYITAIDSMLEHLIERLA